MSLFYIGGGYCSNLDGISLQFKDSLLQMIAAHFLSRGSAVHILHPRCETIRLDQIQDALVRGYDDPQVS